MTPHSSAPAPAPGALTEIETRQQEARLAYIAATRAAQEHFDADIRAARAAYQRAEGVAWTVYQTVRRECQAIISGTTADLTRDLPTASPYPDLASRNLSYTDPWPANIAWPQWHSTPETEG